MKTAYLVLLCVFLFGCGTYMAQPPEKTRYEHIKETTLPPDQVYDKALQWIASTFRSAKAVIEYQDKASGRIIGNGQVDFNRVSRMGVVLPLTFTMTFDVKPGKYKMSFENVLVKYSDGDQPLGDPADTTSAHNEFKRLCDSFDQYLMKKEAEW